MIGLQRRAGRGDVDDDVGRAGGGGAFGGAEAFDDAVELDAVLGGEELLGQAPVFGGDGEAAAVAGAEIGGDVAEIGHGIDIEPDIRHGDDDIGMAEAEADAEFGAFDPLPASPSRTRSSPVTPKSTEPRPISREISEAERKAISISSMPSTRPR